MVKWQRLAFYGIDCHFLLPFVSNKGYILMSKPSAKYRLSFSTREIEYLIALTKGDIAKGESSYSSFSDAISTVQTLAVAKTKIDNMALTPAYNVSNKPKANSLEALGATPDGMMPLSKEQIWELAYNSYISDPTKCSLQQIADAKEHMYLNELMTEAELAEFELGTHTSDNI